jgi:hypothetical protein
VAYVLGGRHGCGWDAPTLEVLGLRLPD